MYWSVSRGSFFCLFIDVGWVFRIGSIGNCIYGVEGGLYCKLANCLPVATVPKFVTVRLEKKLILVLGRWTSRKRLDPSRPRTGAAAAHNPVLWPALLQNTVCH
jgi:hypothetical protein